MIGKVTATSTGHDPGGPRVNDPTLGPGAVPPELVVRHEESTGSYHLHAADDAAVKRVAARCVPRTGAGKHGDDR